MPTTKVSLKELAEAVTKAWKDACAHDGIPHDAKFVGFTSDNPHVERYDRLCRIFQAATKAVRNA